MDISTEVHTQRNFQKWDARKRTQLKNMERRNARNARKSKKLVAETQIL